MSSVRLTWHGPEVQQRVNHAAARAIDETMLNCVTLAAVDAPYDTGALSNDIKVVDRARREGGRTVGRWGSPVVEYTIWQEIGTAFMPGKFFLRGSAAREYPRLAGRIQANARGR